MSHSKAEEREEHIKISESVKIDVEPMEEADIEWRFRCTKIRLETDEWYRGLERFAVEECAPIA